MRTLLFSTAAFAAGLALSAAAQNSAGQQASASSGSGSCGPSAMSSRTSQGVAGSGFTNLAEVPHAVVVHAVDPDGNPVIMIVAPAQ
jgi:hypothetical protein